MDGLVSHDDITDVFHDTRFDDLLDAFGVRGFEAPLVLFVGFFKVEIEIFLSFGLVEVGDADQVDGVHGHFGEVSWFLAVAHEVLFGFVRLQHLFIFDTGACG